MRKTACLLMLCVLVVSSRANAQVADYVPAYRLAEGRELVAVYIGATTCGPCNLPDVKSAIRAMKPLLAAQAKQRGQAFSVIGVAQDWDPKQGFAFLEPLGAFDQIVSGGNWINLGVEQFILRDSLADMAMPQVVLVERTVDLNKRVVVSASQVLRRITGGEAIPKWVASGALVGAVDDKKPQ